MPRVVAQASVVSVDRWLSAVSLVSAAEEAARADFGPMNVVSIAASQSACVALLGLIAGQVDDTRPKDETFIRLLERAVAAAKPRKFPQLLYGELVDVTDVRNLALHRGIAVAHETALRGARTARRLLGALPELMQEDLVGDGNIGIAGAVASRLEPTYLSAALSGAEESMKQGDHIQAAAWLSVAWQEAMRRAHLRTQEYETKDQFPPHKKTAVESAVASLVQKVAVEEVWISRFAIGIDPRSLIRLSEMLGRPYHSESGPPTVSRYGLPEPSTDDVVWAMGRVTEVLYRLWAGGLLDLSAWERSTHRLPTSAPSRRRPPPDP